MVNEIEDIRDRFLEKVRDGEITCFECLALAKELDYPTKMIAPMLTEMKIRIVHCQLGCFS